MAFIFGALLEFALVNYAARKDMIISAIAKCHTNPIAQLTNGGSFKNILNSTVSFKRYYDVSQSYRLV